MHSPNVHPTYRKPLESLPWFSFTIGTSTGIGNAAANERFAGKAGTEIPEVEIVCVCFGTGIGMGMLEAADYQ